MVNKIIVANLHMTFNSRVLDEVSPSIFEATQEYKPLIFRLTPCKTKLEPDMMIPAFLSWRTMMSFNKKLTWKTCQTLRKEWHIFRFLQTSINMKRRNIITYLPLCFVVTWQEFFTHNFEFTKNAIACDLFMLKYKISFAWFEFNLEKRSWVHTSSRICLDGIRVIAWQDEIWSHMVKYLLPQANYYC